jgi:hypothetical protein
VIIDFHAHLFSEWKGIKGLAPGELVQQMDQNEVDHAVVYTLNGFWGDFRKANDALVRLAKPYGSRLIPFCTVHPNEIGKAIDEVDRCKTKYHIQGIKLHPWLQGFSVTSMEMLQLAEHAARREMMLVLHDGSPPYCEPLQIADLARRFPSLTVVLGHGGLKDFHMEALMALQRHPNLVIGCNAPATALERMIHELKGDRILFGSDLGFSKIALPWWLAHIRSLAISEEEKEKVLAGNARRLLKL